MSAQIIHLPRRRAAPPRNNYDWMSVRAMQFFRAEMARQEAGKLPQVRGILAGATPAAPQPSLADELAAALDGAVSKVSSPAETEILKILRRIDRRLAKRRE